MGTEETVEFFSRLMKRYSQSHNGQRPTVEDMKEMTSQEGYNFSVKEVKDYGRKALEKMIR